MRAHSGQVVAVLVGLGMGLSLSCAEILGISEGISSEAEASGAGDSTEGGVSPFSGGSLTGGSAGSSGGSAAEGGTAGNGGAIETAGAGGDSSDAIQYNALDDSDNWTTFDLSAAGLSAGYRGGAFDGRYVYFAPTPHGALARYDTAQAFTNKNAWTMFPMNTSFLNAVGYQGAVYAAGSLYLVPFAIDGVGQHGQAIRYDTTGPFDMAASYASHQTATGNDVAFGFLGGAFDGRYVYFSPHFNTAYDGVVARYDTNGVFTDTAAWTNFDVNTPHPGATGFYGAIAAKGYVYFVPHFNGTHHGLTVRYDTTAPFNDATAWSKFDIVTINNAARGFAGAAFDGRYVYYVANNNGTLHGLIARYDTEASFVTATSWSVFDTAQVDSAAKGFIGGAFDGRYVYFVPQGTPPSGLVVRYDTTANFDLPASYQAYDVSIMNAAAKAFVGAIFDGEYLYFVPSNSTAVARFRARTKAPLPEFMHGGSFY
jgi:hypothetical protein